MSLTIQKAGPQDLEAVATLYGAVCDYLTGKPFNPGWRRDGFPSAEEAARYLAADGLYAAWEDGSLAGSIALTADPSADAERPDAPSDGEADALYIHVLAVHPDCLRQGVGSALLELAAGEAVRRGAVALRLYVWEGNGPAIRAYEKNGFARIGKEDIGLSAFGLEWFYLYEKRLDD